MIVTNAQKMKAMITVSVFAVGVKKSPIKLAKIHITPIGSKREKRVRSEVSLRYDFNKNPQKV